MKPGWVSSAEREPPPIVSRASTTQTEQPSRAISMAAARPFGPEPTTTASNSIVVLYTRGRWHPLQRLSLRRRTMHDGWWPRAGDFAGAPARRTAHDRRNLRERNSIDWSHDRAHQVRSSAASRNRALRGIGRGNREKVYSQ